MATTQQVADFYEVTDYALKMIVNRHKEELISDGYRVLKGKVVLGQFERSNSLLPLSVLNKQGGYLVNDEYFFSYRGVGLFPKRAILRVGMLLRDSAVAKEVRTQLLRDAISACHML